MKEITVRELKQKQDNNENFQLIDVREPHEVEICSIEDAQFIPMGEVMTNVDEIKKDVPVIVMCRSGKRSAAVINALETQFDLDNLHNLVGGILSYADEIDTSLTKY